MSTTRSGGVAHQLSSRLFTAFVPWAAALALSACGGGDADAPSASAQHADIDNREAADLIPAAISPILPNNPRWATTLPCQAGSDFITLGEGVLEVAGLLSRHVGCVTFVIADQPIYAATMPKKDGSGWELCKLSAGRPCAYELAGRAKYSTKWQLYGEPGVLSKMVALNIKMVDWQWDAGFRPGKPSLSLKGKLEVNCSTFSLPAGSTQKPCIYSVPSFTLPVSRNSSADIPAFEVQFAWTEPPAGTYDVASFKLSQKGFIYKVVEADIPVGDKWQLSGLGGGFEPTIRCDRKVTGNKLGKGCVMPQAAAVMVMDSSSSDPAAEAAEHAKDAQTKLQPGMTDFAPGAYSPMPGTRAVFDQLLNLPYKPLVYDPGSTRANRKASCTSTTSLFNSRTYVGSASCPTPGDDACSCDEYPFAATAQGGSLAGPTTSVRSILKTQNSQGGTDFSIFLGKERVLPMAAGDDAFYVYVK